MKYSTKMTEITNSKLHYNSVLCQTFSPDGRYLLAGNIYGDISIYDLSVALGPWQTEDEELLGPTYQFRAHPDQQVQSMLTTNNFLVTGTCGEISGWCWKTATSSKCTKIKPSWTIQIPSKKDSLEKPDVNCLVYSKENHLIYAGCGDNKIHIIKMDNGKVVHSFTGHTNFIHSIAFLGKQLASGGEDGSVRLWDLRTKENTNILQPHLDSKVARPKIGKWIGAVDFTEDWLLCGGGPKLSLWNTRTMEAATIFDLPDEGIHVADIFEERIISGGAMKYLYHLTYQGVPLAKVPISSSTAFSIAYQEQPYKVLSIGGSSNKIDICTNFNYREIVLKFA
ncbi:THO complex subunit 6 homolog [Phymastichus coffea]|uniref:THO complex subunit 6 homolog n=1 Tax=Phymastichus coffea TaxID=108790 RepID=UPI00273CBA6B|nr:THO complex subunit 6 homolog [Phymastichus coffea]